MKAAAPLVAALGDLASLRASLPPELCACVVAMAVALRALAHAPVTPESAVLVLGALREAREAVFGDDLPSLALPLRLVSLAAPALARLPPRPAAAAVAFTAAGAALPAIVEDVLRWSIPPPPPPAVAVAQGSPGSAPAAAAAAALGAGGASAWLTQQLPFHRGGSSADSAALRRLILGLPIDDSVAGAAPHAAAEVLALVALLSQRVCVDVLAAHAMVRASGGQHAPWVLNTHTPLVQGVASASGDVSAAALAALDDALADAVQGTGAGAGGAAVVFAPAVLTSAETEVALPAGGAAAAAAAAGAAPPAVPLRFRSAAGAAAAQRLFDALYEVALRARSDSLTTAPGLAAAFLASVGLLPGLARRSPRRPAVVIWSAVLAVRLIEVRCRRQTGWQKRAALSALTSRPPASHFTGPR